MPGGPVACLSTANCRSGGLTVARVGLIDQSVKGLLPLPSHRARRAPSTPHAPARSSRLATPRHEIAGLPGTPHRILQPSLRARFWLTQDRPQVLLTGRRKHLSPPPPPDSLVAGHEWTLEVQRKQSCIGLSHHWRPQIQPRISCTVDSSTRSRRAVQRIPISVANFRRAFFPRNSSALPPTLRAVAHGRLHRCERKTHPQGFVCPYTPRVSVSSV